MSIKRFDKSESIIGKDILISVQMIYERSGSLCRIQKFIKRERNSDSESLFLVQIKCGCSI